VNVLVVEDDPQLADLLGRVFRDTGHDAIVSGTIEAAERAIAANAFDIVVLDWMLPDGEGLDLCEKLQKRQPPLPVVLLTARGEVHERIAGLRIGADDYVTKPFEIDELLARVDAVHRRSTHTWTTRIGALEIDHRAQTVKVDGKRLDLTAREFGLLLRLAESMDECVSRTTLLSDVWNMSFDPGSGVIDVHVSRLRDKLGVHAWMVETVRGQGLRLRTAK
jgi:DNA-binding response OmpR family regulator